MALDRFELRRAQDVEEANAIRTTYLYATLFDEPHRSQLRSIVRQYAHTRIAPSGLGEVRMEERLEQNSMLRREFWEEARAALYPAHKTKLASHFVGKLNEMLNVGTRRERTGRAQLPAGVLDILLLYLLVSSAVLGYQLKGRKGVRGGSSIMLVILFTMVIVVIIGIDRPQVGTNKVPLGALEKLVAMLDQDATRMSLPGPPPTEHR